MKINEKSVLFSAFGVVLQLPTSNYVGDGFNTSARYVDTVQRALYYLGYLTYSDIDGYWGSTTEAAVESFQFK